MAGERNTWVDTDEFWRPRVRELAESLGFAEKSVWYWFRQLGLCICAEARWPQPCAEWLAWSYLHAVFDKSGARGN